jgi:3-oxoacyl-[acyl-carrier protein] reductase
MHVDLKGKVALVTGAAQGIGKAIADTLAANGARVAYTDIDIRQATESAAKSPGCRAWEMNVADEARVDAVIAEVVRDFGRLDILVNNAGVNTQHHRVTTEQFPRQEWDRIVGIDLTGLYLVSKAGAKVMKAQGGGRIINIASIVGIVPLRLQCAFAAAKAGVIHFTKAMAIELGSAGILVNGVAPGSILTEGTKKLFYAEGGSFRDSVQQMLAHIPLGRPGTVDEVAHAVLFLAAPESSYINGHILTVDGGWTAGYAREF